MTFRAARPSASSAEVRKRMRATPQKNTPLELTLRSALHHLGLRFRVHRCLIPGLRRTVDIVFARARIAVFVDGCFWHGCADHGSLPKKTHRRWWSNKILTNRQRDSDTDLRLEELGWEVLRIWEHEDKTQAAHRIAQRVRNREKKARSKKRSKAVTRKPTDPAVRVGTKV
jgi:DNA mismatch endonuclease (patch repair protein)